MFFPIMIELEDKSVLIVGGGKVAYRKAKKILEFGANLTVLSPDFLDDFELLKSKYKNNKLILKRDTYASKYISDKNMVIAATSSLDTNQQIVKDCRLYNILVNNVDGRNDSNFISPAIYKNDILTISISTGGGFPYLSKKIKNELEKNYSKYNKEYLNILEDIRYKIIEKYPDTKREIMDKILEFDINELKKYKKELNKETKEF